MTTSRIEGELNMGMDAKNLPEDIKKMLREFAKRNELILLTDDDPVFITMCECYVAGVYG